MKKLIAIYILSMSSILFAIDGTTQSPWKVLRPAFTAPATDEAEPNTVERKYATMVADPNTCRINEKWSNIEITFTSDTNDQDTDIVVFAGRTYGDFKPVFSCNVKSGLQLASDGQYYIDTIGTITTISWPTNIIEVGTDGSDDMSSIALDAFGYKYWAVYYTDADVNDIWTAYISGN